MSREQTERERKLWERARALNVELAAKRSDVVWSVVGGELRLVDDPDWSAQHAKWMAEKQEEERQRFLNRPMLDLKGGSDDR